VDIWRDTEKETGWISSSMRQVRRSPSVFSPISYRWSSCASFF